MENIIDFFIRYINNSRFNWCNYMYSCYNYTRYLFSKKYSV